MNLSKRLLAIAKKVPKGNRVADIGTDHAWIPIYLIKNNICNKAIASDINKGPMERANHNINQYCLQEQIETRLGSGLTTISPKEVDTAIIAGMGGILMIEILEKSRKVVESLDTMILQPQLAQEEVRKWLHRNNFYIYEEDLVFEDEKWYEIIVAKKGKEAYEKPIFYEIGKKLFEDKHPLLESFITFRENKYKLIAEKTKEQESEKAKKSYMEAVRHLEQYKEVRMWL